MKSTEITTVNTSEHIALSIHYDSRRSCIA